MVEGRAGAWSCCHAPPVVYLVTHATNSLPPSGAPAVPAESPLDFRILAGREGAVAHLRPGMIERLRTVHDKVGAPVLFVLGGLLGDHVLAYAFGSFRTVGRLS
jgi:hypothetical protein